MLVRPLGLILLSCFSREERIPAQHPLRSIKAYAYAALAEIRALLDGMYSIIGRPSIPPERLLKARLLLALYSVHSDRWFCETLDYNILFRWSLGPAWERRWLWAPSTCFQREGTDYV